MKTHKTKALVFQNILLLLPLILYGIYKNGYLIYQKRLIDPIMILKPLYFVLIGVLIKIIYDLIRYHRIKVDYDLIELILVGMIIPYNTNIYIYSGILLVSYVLLKLLSKHFKCNSVCFIYLVVIIVGFLMNTLSFYTPLDLNYSYNFSLLDILMGRRVGGISSTSILFSLFAYVILINNYYYKKDVPLLINLTYLLLTGLFYIWSRNASLLINNELVFGSIFVSSMPIYSPYKRLNQVFYGVAIGFMSFIIAITMNSIISIYLATFIASLFLNIHRRQKKTKLPISKK